MAAGTTPAARPLPGTEQPGRSPHPVQRRHPVGRCIAYSLAKQEAGYRTAKGPRQAGQTPERHPVARTATRGPGREPWNEHPSRLRLAAWGKMSGASTRAAGTVIRWPLPPPEHGPASAHDRGYGAGPHSAPPRSPKQSPRDRGCGGSPVVGLIRLSREGGIRKEGQT